MSQEHERETANRHETPDEAIVESAIEQFVKQVTAGRWFEANQAAGIAIATARLIEDEDPLARGRW